MLLLVLTLNWQKKEFLTVQDLENKTIILPKITSRTILAQKISKLLGNNPMIQIKEEDCNFDTSLRYVALYQYIAFCTEEFIRDFDQISYIELKSEYSFEYGFACIGQFNSEMKGFIQAFNQWKKQK